MSVVELLAEARAGSRRLGAAEAAIARRDGALIVDIRPAWQRDAEVPGAIVVERNHLEWRLDPESPARISEAVAGQRWIVLCEEGFASSLAAESLRRLGLDATDVIGGISAWREAGLPVVSGPSELARFGRIAV
jgi:rhodanese-related sulfurtransferase